ncbi:MAG: hypothetical protein AAFX94_00670 [Myxococcota bacterium]
MRIFLFAALATVTACRSSQTGNEGNFVFSYFTDDDVTNFNKPIAVEAFLNIQVDEVGSGRDVTLTDAFTDAPGVLDVVDFEAQTVVVTGVSGGNARLNVEGTVRGVSSTDSVDLRTAVPDFIELFHTCTTSRNGHYLTGQAIVVGYELERSNGEDVIGYGYYPTVEDDSSLLAKDVENLSQTYIAYTTGNLPGIVDIDSALPGDAESLTVTLVDPLDIAGARVQIGLLQDITVGEREFFYVLPETASGDPICQANTRLTVRTSSPACTVEEADPADRENEFGWIRVTGVAEGSCDVDVAYPDSLSGNTPVETLRFEIL